jgi:acetyl-CoA carboxylase biotin carboxyl carrier protein
MKTEQLEKLISIFDKSTLLELKYREGDFSLYLNRKGEAGVSAAPSAVVQAAPQVAEEEDIYITSPIVSTFYSSPAPDAKPYVAVGDRIKAGQIVCILEAMKIMTELESDFECEIEAVLVSSGQKVEYGQPLFRVKRHVS